MTEQGYDREFSAAVTAASATVGPIIPPSIPFVVHACMAEVSLGRLFLGGFLPGFLLGGLMMVYVYFIAKRRNYPRTERFSFRELLKSFIVALPALFTPVLMLGGIVLGIFSPTEGAAVTAVYALLVGVLVYRSLSWRDFINVLKETARASAVILFILGVASFYIWLVSVAQIPQIVTDTLLRITHNKFLILALINLVLLIAGCFMESMAIMMVSLPILLPIVTAIGVDLVHFGIMMTLNLMIGLVTPPIGLSLYVVSDVAKVPIGRVVKEILPFFIPLFIALLLITYIPQISLWLPNFIMGTAK